MVETPLLGKGRGLTVKPSLKPLDKDQRGILHDWCLENWQRVYDLCFSGACGCFEGTKGWKGWLNSFIEELIESTPQCSYSSGGIPFSDHFNCSTRHTIFEGCVVIRCYHWVALPIDAPLGD